MNDRGKSTPLPASNIKIGHSIIDSSNNVINDKMGITFARINLKTD
jgi:hypothetical protein